MYFYTFNSEPLDITENMTYFIFHVTFTVLAKEIAHISIYCWRIPPIKSIDIFYIRFKMVILHFFLLKLNFKQNKYILWLVRETGHI